VVILLSAKTCGHSPKVRFVVISKEAILKGAKASFNPALSLRRICLHRADAEFLQYSAYMSRIMRPLQLLVDAPGVIQAHKNTMPVMRDGHGHTVTD
jgi:hypothetical protein